MPHILQYSRIPTVRRFGLHSTNGETKQPAGSARLRSPLPVYRNRNRNRSRHRHRRCRSRCRRAGGPPHSIVRPSCTSTVCHAHATSQSCVHAIRWHMAPGRPGRDRYKYSATMTARPARDRYGATPLRRAVGVRARVVDGVELDTALGAALAACGLAGRRGRHAKLGTRGQRRLGEGEGRG